MRLGWDKRGRRVSQVFFLNLRGESNWEDKWEGANPDFVSTVEHSQKLQTEAT